VVIDLNLKDDAEGYFEARERRIAMGLRVSEVLNHLVRPLLAIMMGGAIVFGFLIGAITSGEFLGIAAVVVGFFFQSRQTEKAEERLQAQQREVVELSRALPPKPVGP
jgi:hypothetical protein